MTAIVVRPLGACESTSHFLNERGITSIPLPLLKVEPVLPGSALVHETFAASDVVVATSGNVAFGLSCYQSAINKGLPLCAVGSKTAAQLCSFFERIYIPKSHSSEGLIELLEQHNNWKRIALLKGEGGRTAIQSKMTLTGRKVRTLSFYRRVINNQIEPADIRWQYVQYIVITSVELVTQLLARVSLNISSKIIWVVLSERIAAALREVGINNIIVTQGTDNNAIFEALVNTNTE